MWESVEFLSLCVHLISSSITKHPVYSILLQVIGYIWIVLLCPHVVFSWPTHVLVAWDLPLLPTLLWWPVLRSMWINRGLLDLYFFQIDIWSGISESHVAQFLDVWGASVLTPEWMYIHTTAYKHFNFSPCSSQSNQSKQCSLQLDLPFLKANKVNLTIYRLLTFSFLLFFLFILFFFILEASICSVICSVVFEFSELPMCFGYWLSVRGTIRGTDLPP